MNRVIFIIWMILISIGCQTTEFDPPEYSPIFKAELNFSDGADFLASAGINNYYLHTKGFESDSLKLYSSTLSSDLDCNNNCQEQLTLNIFQGAPNADITSIDQLDFLSKNTQNVIHTLEASIDNSKVYSSLWKVNDNNESALSFIEFNQEYGENEDIGVDLIYTSGYRSIIRYGQTFSPLSEENFTISIDLSKDMNGDVRIRVVDDGNIEFINWNDGVSNLVRIFSGAVKTSFNVISKSGQQINCSVKLPQNHPEFELVNLGYSYENKVVPEIPLEKIESGEVVYTDHNGDIYRSSQVSQILPNYFKVKNLEEYLENEEGILTYSAIVEFKCLVFCRETGKTKYISQGMANFAFVDSI